MLRENTRKRKLQNTDEYDRPYNEGDPIPEGWHVDTVLIDDLSSDAIIE